MTPKFNNGDRVKDRVTGLEGIITAVTVFLNGCVRCSVQPQTLHEGKPVEASYFDQNDLELVKADAIPSTKPRETGGPQRGEREMGRR